MRQGLRWRRCPAERPPPARRRDAAARDAHLPQPFRNYPGPRRGRIARPDVLEGGRVVRPSRAVVRLSCAPLMRWSCAPWPAWSRTLPPCDGDGHQVAMRPWPARRPGIALSPRPHDGPVLVETRDMEGDLRLVREGHRDGVAVHGVGTPRAGVDRGPVPPRRTCDLDPVAALPALHGGYVSPPPSTGNASRTCREPDSTPVDPQPSAGRSAEARDAWEDGIPISSSCSVACRTGQA